MIMVAGKEVAENASTIRDLERESIRKFVEDHREHLTGRVMDFGAGKPGTCLKPQPYRDLVSGEYVPIDEGDEIPHVECDAILCTQVIQFFADPGEMLMMFNTLLKIGGALMMTGPTNWPEVEVSDLFRFTKSGILSLLERTGFAIKEVRQRAEIEIGGFKLSLGWGVLAVKL